MGLISLVVAVGPTRADAEEVHRILLIHSFGQDFAPFDALASSFRRALETQSEEPLEVFQVSLESALYSSDSPSDAPLTEYLRALFVDAPPDLVVTLGGPAARFSQNYRERLFRESPLLMVGVDGRHLRDAVLSPLDRALPVENQPLESIEDILKILPETETVAVVVGNSPLEQFWFKELKRDFQPLAERVHLVWLHDLAFQELVERCASLPPHAVIFYAIFYLDSNGVPYTAKYALDQLHTTANAPIFGLHSSQMGDGIVGGALMDIPGLGLQAADTAVRLLGGEAPGGVVEETTTPGTPQYDSRELLRWEIAEANLPPGSIVRFREPSLWQRYWGWFVGGTILVVMQGVFIGGLAINLLRRRRAEQARRESEERLSLATEAANIGIWVLDPPGTEVWATRKWCEIFGLPPDDRIAVASVLDRIHPGDRESFTRGIDDARAQGTTFSGEFRLQTPDSSERWLVALGRAISGSNGKAERMLGVSIDVTARKESEKAAQEFARRLITAQENDRSRLGRELHDDITQRLARFAIDVATLERTYPDPALSDAAGAIRTGLMRLSEDVSSMAYHLHPAVLDDLGLVEALRTECSRLSRLQQTQADFRVGDIPTRLPWEPSLCLFRVAQEALRNVGRHSGAKSVDVTIEARDSGLQLLVQDTGIGFVPDAPRDHFSLGLRSMKERVHMVNGQFDIESSPGRGTTVKAWVPLRPNDSP